jgi:uncharacterized protein YegJ (DUF2314 family)
MRLLIAATLLALGVPAAAHAQNRTHDKITGVAANDPSMEAAKARARAELPVFFAHVGAPGPGESYFLVKYDLTPDKKAEFVWAEVISYKGGTIVARLINNPIDARFAKGRQVTVMDSQVIDWGYLRNGVMQGNYTTRALLDHLPPAEAAGIRRAYGW